MRLMLLLFTLLLPFASFADCTPSANSCDFYRCEEEHQNCGPKGYWQNFGYPYCMKFLKNQSSFSRDSQRWLTDVRECLQVRVGEVAAHLSCNHIEKEALDSHVSCYVDTGFCHLKNSEKWKIYWYLKGSLRNPRTWYEAVLLSYACSPRLQPTPL